MCLLASCVFRQQKGVSYSTIAELLEFTSAALKRKERHRLQGGQWIEPSGICGLTWYLLLDLTTKPLLLAPLRPLHYTPKVPHASTLLTYFSFCCTSNNLLPTPYLPSRLQQQTSLRLPLVLKGLSFARHTRISSRRCLTSPFATTPYKSHTTHSRHIRGWACNVASRLRPLTLPT